MSKSEVPVHRKRAVALKYDPEGASMGRQAPEVIAKGAGFMAEQILKKAEEAGVHVHEDSDLVEMLGKLEIGQEIPEVLYSAVAKVLATVYAMNQRFSQKDRT